MNGKREIVAAVILIALAAVSFARDAVYSDPIRLYTDVVAKSPDKARPHNNLGHYLKIAGRQAEAQAQFERALALMPEYPDALNNLATIYTNIGRRQEGIALLQNCLLLNPAHIQARYNLAMQFYEGGFLPEAEREYWNIIKIAPQSGEAAFAQRMIQMIQSGKRMQ
ncbi:MAG: tetratricopeptide repeat protein [Nitrospiraceae bacterium]|nr:tetratricopeptide repeat protein [Nitrospiraceae bacterium]